tara:strand:- start:3494 stop:3967 length:474 start_codon:yes stop_codon:yes gene_type:complete
MRNVILGVLLIASATIQGVTALVEKQVVPVHSAIPEYTGHGFCDLRYVDCGSYANHTTSTEGIRGIVTAYTATASETDDSPCITASGLNVCPEPFPVVANNCYPFGTMVVIANVEYTVHDRKNSRYGCEWWDILLPTQKEALQWGIQEKEIVIYENP